MKPITLYIFVHDDVPSSIVSTLGRGYFKEFTDEIAFITGRSFAFNEVRHVQGVTDHNYKGENVDDILWSWQKAAAGYKNDKGLESVTVSTQPMKMPNWAGMHGAASVKPTCITKFLTYEATVTAIRQKTESTSKPS